MADHLRSRHSSPATRAVGPDLLSTSGGFPLCPATGRESSCLSKAEKAASAGGAERGKRLLPPRFRLGQELLKHRMAPQRVELGAAGERRGDEVALGYGTPQVAEPPFVLRDVVRASSPTRRWPPGPP